MPFDDTRANLLLKYGLCGDCNRVYDIKLGFNYILTDDQLLIIKNNIKKYEAQIHEFIAKKAKYRQQRKFKLVVDCTNEIKRIRRLAGECKRNLYPVPISCPHCSWYPRY